MHQPRQSVDRLAGLSNQVALGTISAPQSGSINRPVGSYGEAMSSTWSHLVEVPFAGLDFSDVAWALGPPPPEAVNRADESFCDDVGALALIAVYAHYGSEKAKRECAAEADRSPPAEGRAMLRRRRSRPRPTRSAPPGVPLGRRLAGDRVLPLTPCGRLLWPFEQMRRHALILGASGSGKTETSLRIAHHLAANTDALVFYLDAKGDRDTASRFCGLMRAAGRSPRVFPHEPLDGWRGDWRAIANRLLEVIQFAPEGPASYYRDIAKTALQLACRHPDGPPRSSGELVHRLDYERLFDAHGPSSALLALPRDKVSQVRLRYHAFFGQLGCQLDGGWSFDEADCAYLLLDSVALGEDTAAAASLAFSDFAHFFSQRKPRDRLCLMVCDEFAAISTASDLALRVEQARGFNTALVLVPQTLGGMGCESQRGRIVGSVETLIAHAGNEPERLAELAGNRQVLELSHRLDRGDATGDGLARLERRPRLDPDRIRELPVGAAWVIRRGRAARVAIDRAPQVPNAALPPSQPLDPPLRPLENELPKQIAYLEEEG